MYLGYNSQKAETSALVTLTADSTAHTKGGWTELISSTTYSSAWARISLVGLSDDDSYLVDIGIGSAASETVKINNLMLHSGGRLVCTYCYGSFPLLIPEGTRISARVQSSVSSNTCQARITLFPTSFLNVNPAGQKILTLGATTADSGGTQIAQNNGTKGSWVQMVASLENTISGFMLANGHGGNVGTSGIRVAYDIAIGAAASEQIVFPDWQVRHTALEITANPVSTFIPLTIGEGSRVALRGGGNSNADPADFIMYGVV